jgi:transcriptional regulator with XRE-family HTH domain
MSKPCSILREKMKPAARKKAAEKTKILLDAMPLQESRHARNLSQEQLAQTLSVKQAAVSKLEKRTDMYISTLRNFIKAMGGDLEIIATSLTGPFRSVNLKTLLQRQKPVESLNYLVSYSHARGGIHFFLLYVFGHIIVFLKKVSLITRWKVVNNFTQNCPLFRLTFLLQ